jgi:hypothetical protein
VQRLTRPRRCARRPARYALLLPKLTPRGGHKTDTSGTRNATPRRDSRTRPAAALPNRDHRRDSDTPTSLAICASRLQFEHLSLLRHLGLLLALRYLRARVLESFALRRRRGSRALPPMTPVPAARGSQEAEMAATGTDLYFLRSIGAPKCQVLRTRRPTGLDATTLSAAGAAVKRQARRRWHATPRCA